MMQHTDATRSPDALRALSDSEIRARTVRLLSAILEREPETVATARNLRADLGMDSLNALEFLSMLSVEFSINLEVEEAYGLITLDEVVSLVSRRIREPR